MSWQLPHCDLIRSSLHTAGKRSSISAAVPADRRNHTLTAHTDPVLRFPSHPEVINPSAQQMTHRSLWFRPVIRRRGADAQATSFTADRFLLGWFYVSVRVLVKTFTFCFCCSYEQMSMCDSENPQLCCWSSSSRCVPIHSVQQELLNPVTTHLSSYLSKIELLTNFK